MSLARTTLQTSVVMLTRLAAQAATLALLAAALGATRFGIYAGTASIAVLLGTVANGGTNFLTVRQVARGEDSVEALALAVPTTLALGGILLVPCFWIARALPHALDGIDVVAIATGELIVAPLLALASAEAQGRDRVARAQLLLTLPLALRAIAAAVILLARPADPVRVFAFSSLAAGCLVALASPLVLGTRWPRLPAWRRPRRAEVPHMLGFAALNLTGNAPAELDKALGAALLAPAQAGVYAAASRVLGALCIPVISLVLSALPRLFRLGPMQSRQLATRVFVVTLGYGVAAALGLLVLAASIRRVPLGDFQAVPAALALLAYAIPGMALRIAAGGVLTAADRAWNRVAFEIVGLATLAGGAVVMVRGGRLDGLAIALAISEWAMALLGWLLVARQWRASTGPVASGRGSAP